MLIYNDLISGKEVCTDANPTKSIYEGAVMSVESKKVQVGGESIDIGGNASKEEEEEKLEDEIKTVINIVESHSLQKIEFTDVKDYKTAQQAYYKTLLDAINQQKYDLLFEGKAPAKEEAKAKEAEAVSKLSAFNKKEYDLIEARIANFKKNFKAMQDFVKDEVVKNFKEFDFYIPAEPTALGKCMIIPARWIGDAASPTFYYFVDGLLEEKA